MPDMWDQEHSSQQAAQPPCSLCKAVLTHPYAQHAAASMLPWLQAQCSQGRQAAAHAACVTIAYTGILLPNPLPAQLLEVDTHMP